MRKITDLRSFLQVLEDAGQLVRIQKPVSLSYELADVAAALERQAGPAPLFENVVRGEPSDPGALNAARSGGWPVFCSGVANQARAALALECEKDEVVDVMRRALDPSNGIPPVQVENAAWKAHVVAGDEVDVRKLPIPVHAVGDGGPFITGGVIVSKDPAGGRGNLSYNRMQVKGADQFGLNVNEWRHVHQFLNVQEERDEPLPLAVAIGLDPAIMIAAGARYDDDELLIAGAIRG
jgi:2,5-furandicarboxylate decarboxylase 1